MNHECQLQQAFLELDRIGSELKTAPCSLCGGQITLSVHQLAQAHMYGMRIECPQCGREIEVIAKADGI